MELGVVLYMASHMTNVNKNVNGIKDFKVERSRVDLLKFYLTYT